MSFLTVYNEDYIGHKGTPRKPVRPERNYVDFGEKPIEVKRSRSGERKLLVKIYNKTITFYAYFLSTYFRKIINVNVCVRFITYHIARKK